MRFLLDQDVYEVTRRFLCQLGHEATRAADLGLSRAEDADLVARATQEGRLFAAWRPHLANCRSMNSSTGFVTVTSMRLAWHRPGE